MRDEYIYGAGSKYDWVKAFVIAPMLNGKVLLQPTPENTYQFRPEKSNFHAGLKTVGLLGALLLGAGFMAAQAQKKPR